MPRPTGRPFPCRTPAVRLLQQAPHAPEPGAVAPCRETERFVREVFFHGTGPARVPLVCKNVVAVELLRAWVPVGSTWCTPTTIGWTLTWTPVPG